jgi:23S rRNA pseudouridine2605 synthase
LRIAVSEGRSHLIKRMCAAVGHPVVRLFRPSHAGISLEGLQPGRIRALAGPEIESLRRVAGGETPVERKVALPPPRRPPPTSGNKKRPLSRRAAPKSMRRRSH